MVVGFQVSTSVVRPIGATRTSRVTSVPSEIFSTTVVACSSGSELSSVNGIRRVFPAIPNVGTSSDSTSRSGRRVRLPAASVNTGTPASLNFTAA